MNKKYIGIGVVVVGAILVYRLFFQDRELMAATATKLEKEQTEQAKAVAIKKAQDDSLTRCYVRASILLEKNLKDPDSFQEIEKQNGFVNNPTPKMYIQVRIKYRAKNSFGGYAVETKCFNFNKSLEMTETYACD